MEQHEIVAARFQDGPLNELYAIVGRNDRDLAALTDWIAKHIHNVTITSTGEITTHTSRIKSGTTQIQWGYSHSSGVTSLNFFTIQL